MAISSFGGTSSAASGTSSTYYGGQGTFTLNLPAAAYNVTPYTSLYVDGDEISAGTDTKIFGSISNIQSTYQSIDFSSNIESGNVGSNLKATATNGSRLVAGTDGIARLYYSDNDGATWTAGTGVSSSDYSQIESVAWDPTAERFLATTKKSSDNYWRWLQSSDGASWSELSRTGTTSNTNFPTRLFVFDNGYVVATATDQLDILEPNSDTVRRYSNGDFTDNGSSHDPVNGKLFMINGGSTTSLFVIDVASFSGTLPSSKSPSLGTSVHTIMGSGDTVIAVTSSAQYKLSQDGGSTWGSLTSIPGISNSINSISYYANGQFIIYGYNGSGAYVGAVSLDGLTWSNFSQIEYTGVRQYNYYNGTLYITWDSSRNYFNKLSAPLATLKAKIEKLGDLVAPDA